MIGFQPPTAKASATQRRGEPAVEASQIMARIIDDLCWDLTNEREQYGTSGIESVRVFSAEEPNRSIAEVVTHGGQTFRVRVELVRGGRS